jgi:hypothetical protein
VCEGRWQWHIFLEAIATEIVIIMIMIMKRKREIHTKASIFIMTMQKSLNEGLVARQTDERLPA